MVGGAPEVAAALTPRAGRRGGRRRRPRAPPARTPSAPSSSGPGCPSAPSTTPSWRTRRVPPWAEVVHPATDRRDSVVERTLVSRSSSWATAGAVPTPGTVSAVRRPGSPEHLRRVPGHGPAVAGGLSRARRSLACPGVGCSPTSSPTDVTVTQASCGYAAAPCCPPDVTGRQCRRPVGETGAGDFTTSMTPRAALHAGRHDLRVRRAGGRPDVAVRLGDPVTPRRARRQPVAARGGSCGHEATSVDERRDRSLAFATVRSGTPCGGGRRGPLGAARTVPGRGSGGHPRQTRSRALSGAGPASWRPRASRPDVDVLAPQR